ncbi:MAG: peptidoglycan-binding protein [Actinobacteria bacterium]|nr:peptidoglycan-binding protein [Actinomycetota bacterium]
MANVDVTLQLPVLRRGGDNPIHTVKHVQEMLIYIGKHDLAADDDFGPKTEETVRIFQQNNNLQVDGIVGRETWRALLTRWVFGFQAG